jgi:6-phosphogluconolactonase (cycloisomerase 2 family)
MQRCLFAGVLAVGLLAPSAAWAGSTVYAANDDAGTISAFSVGAGGALTQIGTGTASGPSGSAEAESVVVSPSGQYVYASNEGTGAIPGTVATFSIGAGGALTEQGTGVDSGSTSTDSDPGGLSISPNGQNLYAANYGQGTVSAFSIGAGGALTQIGTGVTSGASTSSTPYRVIVSPGGNYVYSSNFDAGTVSTFSIGAGGALTQIGTGVTSGSGSGSGPWGLATTPNGQYLYVSNYYDGTVSTFSIGAGGALTAVGSPLSSGDGAEDLTVSPNGQNLYVANYLGGTVSTFSIGAGGALTAVGSPLTSASAATPAVSPNGQYLYLSNYNEGAVSTFSIGAGGALTPVGMPVTSGADTNSEPWGIVVSPDQGPTAAYTPAVAEAGSPSAFSAVASTAGSAPIGSYSWQFGDGSTATGATVDHAFATPGTYNVTLTLTDTDLCSVSGPFVGTSSYCATDPAATVTRTITVPPVPVPVPKPKIGLPTVSHDSIAGVAKRKPKLTFTLTAGKNAPALHTIAVSLPRGLSFSTKKKRLAHDITVKGKKFTAKVSHGTLTITLAAATAKAQVTIISPELSASKGLAGKVKKSKTGKHHKAVKLTFKLKATDIHHTATTLSLKLTAG